MCLLTKLCCDCGFQSEKLQLIWKAAERKKAPLYCCEWFRFGTIKKWKVKRSNLQSNPSANVLLMYSTCTYSYSILLKIFGCEISCYNGIFCYIETNLLRHYILRSEFEFCTLGPIFGLLFVYITLFTERFLEKNRWLGA